VSALRDRRPAAPPLPPGLQEGVCADDPEWFPRGLAIAPSGFPGGLVWPDIP
jgi:hypothetical protein